MGVPFLTRRPHPSTSSILFGSNGARARAAPLATAVLATDEATAGTRRRSTSEGTNGGEERRGLRRRAMGDPGANATIALTAATRMSSSTNAASTSNDPRMMPGSASKSVAWSTHVGSSHARRKCAAIDDWWSSPFEKATSTGRTAMSGTSSGVSVTVALSPTTASTPVTASARERLDVRTANWRADQAAGAARHAVLPHRRP